MNHQEVTLVQASFARLLPLADRAVPRFYANLLAIDPTLRASVPRNLRVSGPALMLRLGQMINSLDRPHVSMPLLRAMLHSDQRQPRNTAHLAKVARAAMTTLMQLLGPELDGPCRAAWGALYFLALGVIAEDALWGEQPLAA
jgi:methyl-accepting chemotaxis protein